MDVLTELQNLEEFKLDTPLNKAVLSHISTLLNLQENQRTTFLALIAYLTDKVKSLLLPCNITRFHQNFHKFRSCDLVIKLVEIDLPAEVCQDFILWQCLIDKILEKEMTLSRAEHAQKHCRIFYPVEQNAIRYTAGAILRKLLDKNKLNEGKTFRINLLLKKRKDIDISDNDSSEYWLKKTDRGGLLYITDLALELFVEIEVFLYYHITMKQNSMDTTSLSQMACLDPDILGIWSQCVIESNYDDTPLLMSIVQDWRKCRGHSIARSKMEKHFIFI